MRKHLSILLILFFVVSIFAQDQIEHIASLVEGETKGLYINQDHLIINCQNMINIYSLESDTLEYVSKIDPDDFIYNMTVSDSFVLILTKRIKEYYHKIYVYDISDINTPHLALQTTMSELDIHELTNIDFIDKKKLIFSHQSETDASITHVFKFNPELSKFDTLDMPYLHVENIVQHNILIGKETSSGSNLVIYDISDFESPELLAEFEYLSQTYSNDSILVSYNFDTLKLYSLNDRESIEELSSISHEGYLIHIHNNKLLNLYENKLTKYNISDLYSPELEDSLIFPSTRTSVVYCDSILIADETMAYSINTFDEITGPAYYDTQSDVIDSDNIYRNKKYSFSITYDRALLGEGDLDLESIIIDGESYACLFIQKNYMKNYYPIFNKENILLTRNQSSEYFKIVDYRDLDFVTISEITMGFRPMEIQFVNDMAFAINPSHELNIYNFSELPEFEHIYENTELYVDRLNFSEEYIFVIHSEGLTVLDINTFEELLTIDDIINDCVQVGSYLYIATDSAGLTICDFSDTDAPSFYYVTDIITSRLHAVDNNIICKCSRGIVSLDLTDPIFPVEMGVINSYSHYKITPPYILTRQGSDWDHTDYLYNVSNPDTFQLIRTQRYSDGDIFSFDNYFLQNLGVGSSSYLYYPVCADSFTRLTISTDAEYTFIDSNKLFTSFYYCFIDMYDISSLTESIEEPRAEIGTPDEFSLGTYPNPFNSTVSIETEGAERIEIYDINGKKVAQFNTNENTNINWTPEKNINSGVYLVKAMNNNSQLSDGSRELAEKVIYIK